MELSQGHCPPTFRVRGKYLIFLDHLMRNYLKKQPRKQSQGANILTNLHFSDN